MSLSNLHIKISSVMAASLLSAMSAQSATLTVTSSGDNGGSACTLRQAINSINSEHVHGGCSKSGDDFGIDDTIRFNSGIDTIALLKGQLEIVPGKEVTINGGSRQGLKIIGGKTDSDNERRVFFINKSILELRGLTISGGVANLGGGIYAKGSTVSLIDVEVSGNTAASGGGIFVDRVEIVEGGGISMEKSDLKLTRSNVISNESGPGAGAGIHAVQSDVILTDSTVSANTIGHGIVSKSDKEGKDIKIELEVTNSVISDNGGGGVLASSKVQVGFIGSVVSKNNQFGIELSLDSSSEARLIDTSVSDNQAGGINAVGIGGVGDPDGRDLTLERCSVLRNRGRGVTALLLDSFHVMNSTVSGNSSSFDGGGIHAGDRVRFNMYNSTVTNNSTEERGGGIFLGGDGGRRLIGSIVSGNSADGEGAEIFVEVLGSTNVARNLFGDRRHETGSAVKGLTIDEEANVYATSDRDNIALSSILAPLAHNGGPTMTHGLVKGSPAIGNSNPGSCKEVELHGYTYNLGVDQRTQPRDENHCDIGAFEGVVEDTSFFVVPLKESGKSVIFGL